MDPLPPQNLPERTRTTPETLAYWLRKVRIWRGMTQEKLAARAHVSARTISSIEAGEKRARRKAIIEKLAQGLQLEGNNRAAFLALRPSIVRQPSRPRKASATPAPKPWTIPFVGRAMELAQIERLLNGHEVSALLFSSEYGMGKTRLLHESRKLARKAGYVVLSGRYQADKPYPYAPVIQTLRAYLTTLTRKEQRRLLANCSALARWLPDFKETGFIGPAQRLGTLEEEKHQLFMAISRVLGRIAESGGVLLELDDLQWAELDDLRLLVAIVGAAAHSGDSGRVRILAALRNTRLAENPPLSHLLTNLAQDGHLDVVRVGPLGEEQAATLLRAALTAGGMTPDEQREPDIQEAVARAGGAPFALLDSAREMRYRQGYAALEKTALEMPSEVTEMVLERVNGLSETAKVVLTIAALYERDAPMSLLIEASDRPEPQVIEAIEAIFAVRLMSRAEDGAARFPHDLYRDAIRAEVPDTQARLVRHRIAMALEADAQRADAESLAHQYGRSADSGSAALERAGDEALEWRAPAAAEGCYRAALERIAANDAENCGRVREKLGALLAGCGRYTDALDELEGAVSAFESIGNSGANDRVGLVVAQIGWAHVRRGTAADGLARIAPLLAGEVLAGLAPLTQAALWCAHAVTLFGVNRYSEQLMSARRAEALSSGAGDPKAQAQALRLAGLALVMLGRLPEALPILNETLRIAERVGDLDSFSAALNDTAAVYRTQGDLRASQTYSARSARVADLMGDPTGTAFLTASQGDNLYLLGAWTEARACYDRALAIARGLGESWVLAYPLISLGQLSLALGQCEEAEAALGEALACAARNQDLQAQRIAQTVLAERDLLLGDAAGALARLNPLVTPTTARDPLPEPPTTVVVGDEKETMALLPFLGWARLEMGNRLGAALSLARCRTLAEAMGARLVLVDTWLVEARLAIAMRSWSTAERALTDALEAIKTMECPYAEAKAHYLFGLLHVERGLSERAREELDQARSICLPLGERPYLSLIEAALDRLPSGVET